FRTTTIFTTRHYRRLCARRSSRRAVTGVPVHDDLHDRSFGRPATTSAAIRSSIRASVRAGTCPHRSTLRPGAVTGSIATNAALHLLVPVGIAAEQAAVRAGQAADRGNLVRGELEREQIEVGALPLGVGRLRDGQ